MTDSAASRSASQSIFGAVLYDDPRAAMAWLERAFGAEPFVCYDAPDGSVAHAEMRLAGDTFMVGLRRDGSEAGAGLYVALESPAAIDALCERARAAGASITREPSDTDYGSHEFGATDLEGRSWSFGTYRCGVTKA